MADLSLGNVVRLVGQDAELVVEDVLQGGAILSLRGDDDRLVTVRNGPETLQRVLRQPGDMVRSLVSGSVGMVQAEMRVEDGVRYYRVQFADGRAKTVLESDLRLEPITDPLQRLQRGMLESVRPFQIRLMAVRLRLAHQYDELTTLSNTRLEIKPHQVFVAHRVVENPPHRYLLADEVGLGKTIEAGLVLKELRARGVVKRVLIIPPANLTRQWLWELHTKFNESFTLYNAERIAGLREENPGENVWTLRDRVICSAQYLTTPDRAEGASGQRASYAREENLPDRMRELLRAEWDLVIVDEAHHARRSARTPDKHETNILYWFLSHLARHTPHLLLLTATPMQLDASELYWLLELLDPALFPSWQDFEAARRETATVNTIIGAVRRWDKPDGPRHDPALRVALIDRILPMLDQYGSGDWDADLLAAALDRPASRQSLLERLAQDHRLSERIIRNRKSEVGGFMPREARIVPVALSPAEQEAYTAVTAYVREGYRRSRELGNHALGFVMVSFQKLLSSSSHALDRALERRQEHLTTNRPLPRHSDLDPDILDHEDEDEDEAERLLDIGLGTISGVDVATELAVLADLRIRIARIAVDTKLTRLREVLAALPPTAEDGMVTPTKVLIFSQFRETVLYLAGALEREHRCAVFHGTLSLDAKDDAARRFREPSGAQILISTEAGGEGRNFQFCHMMVNYDLPWNPMRVEQRIGRLDRIGQRHPIRIYNFTLEGTIEERVVAVLHDRIRLFEETIGGIEPILGEVARDLRALIMAQDGADVARFTETLVRSVEQARELERQQADFVMDMRSFSQAEAQRVIEAQAPLGYEDLRRWARVALPAMGCKLEKRQDRQNVYEMRVFEEFKRRFHHSHFPRMVTFDRDSALEDESLEFLAFGHPFIDGAADVWQRDEFGGQATSWALRDPELPAFDGYLFAFVATFAASRRIERLYPIAVDNQGRIDDEMAATLLGRCGDYAKHTEFPPEPPPTAHLQGCYEVAERHLQALLSAEQARLSARAAQTYDAEIARLGRYFTYRRTVAAQKVRAIEGTLARLRAGGEGNTAVLPMWEANLEHSKSALTALTAEERRERERLTGRRNVGYEYELLSAAAVRNTPA